MLLTDKITLLQDIIPQKIVSNETINSLRTITDNYPFNITVRVGFEKRLGFDETTDFAFRVERENYPHINKHIEQNDISKSLTNDSSFIWLEYDESEILRGRNQPSVHFQANNIQDKNIKTKMFDYSKSDSSEILMCGYFPNRDNKVRIVVKSSGPITKFISNKVSKITLDSGLCDFIENSFDYTLLSLNENVEAENNLGIECYFFNDRLQNVRFRWENVFAGLKNYAEIDPGKIEYFLTLPKKYKTSGCSYHYLISLLLNHIKFVINKNGNIYVKAYFGAIFIN